MGKQDRMEEQKTKKKKTFCPLRFQVEDIARRAYIVTVLCIGPDKSGEVRTGVKRYFSSTVSHTQSKFGPPPNLHAVF